MSANFPDDSAARTASNLPATAAPPPRAHDAAAYRHRGWVALVILAPFALAALTRPPPLPSQSGGAIALDALGWAAFLAYAGLRLWATLYVGGRKDLALQASGPYALCRNPLYLGSFALAIAVAAFLQDVVFACAVLVVASLYAWLVVPAEERALLARFGEAYREYTASTPRFVPRFRRPAGPAVLEVDTRRFLAEGRRLTRAALFVLVLHAIASARPF